MLEKLNRLLDYLARHADSSEQKEIESLYQRTLNYENVERLPLYLSYPLPEDSPFLPFPHGEVASDPDKMLYNELVHAFGLSIANRFAFSVHDDLPFTVRANFGTVVMASMFGGKVESRDDNPPWVAHFESKEEFANILDTDPHDHALGLCPRVLERCRYFREVLSSYPELSGLIHLVLPDLQGPLDTLDVLRGSDMYLDFYEDPDIVERSLALIAEAQVSFAKTLLPYVSRIAPGFTCQHGTMIRGNILIRNDSTVMLSPDMYREMVSRHDEHVLASMGGGGIHSCGTCGHQIENFLSLPAIRSFDFGQSYLNDADAAYRSASKRKIPLIRVVATREELVSGSIIERFPTGVVLTYEAESPEEAREVIDAYKASAEKIGKR